METGGVHLDYLRRVPLLQALGDKDLLDLLERADEIVLEPGTVLFREGDQGDDLYVVLEGELLISRRVREIDDVIAARGPGEFVGEMAVVVGRPRSATVTAGQRTRLLKLGRAAFEELLARSSHAATAIVGCMATRIEDEQVNRSRDERLVALGTMAAGLAHELNNPASALARSTEALSEALAARDRAVVQLLAGDLSAAEKDMVLKLGEAAAERSAAAAEGGDGRSRPLPDPDDEDALTDYLTDIGLEEPWEAAPALLQAGWTKDDVSSALSSFQAVNRPAVARWLSSDAVSRVLLSEIAMATGSIVAQVKAVKVSSHMDRASFDEVDVREGLESALVMVKRKLGSGIKVVREYDPDLPRIEAFPGELNQVWTNLIDNALDAMGGSGVLTLRVQGGDGQVSIEVSDTGPGIPAEVLPKLFEPYFTTKGVGEGTGLGLPLALKTVEQRHGGRIRVASMPGSTTFRVTLPIARRKAFAAAAQPADA
ncbi:MAG TPA: ATP-binding protein [Trueperaceae bacterium]